MGLISWYRRQKTSVKAAAVGGISLVLAAVVTGSFDIVPTLIDNHSQTSQSNPSGDPAVSTASYVKIQWPPMGTSEPPVSSAVECTEDVRGVAEIPSGDVVVVANKLATTSSWHLTDVGQPLGKDWSVTVRFSAPHKPDAGQVFHLAAFAMKASDIPASAIHGNWDLPILPSTTVRPDQGLVKRSFNTKDRCNWAK
jgi:hypothetical protein